METLLAGWPPIVILPVTGTVAGPPGPQPIANASNAIGTRHFKNDFIARTPRALKKIG